MTCSMWSVAEKVCIVLHHTRTKAYEPGVVGWAIMTGSALDSSSNAGSVSHPSCGIQFYAQKLPHRVISWSCCERSSHSTTSINPKLDSRSLNNYSALNGQQPMPRKSHMTFKVCWLISKRSGSWYRGKIFEIVESMSGEKSQPCSTL